MTTLTAPRPMPRLLARIVIASERWKLKSCNDWMKACAHDGIAGTESMSEWRKQAQAHRVYIAILESQL